MAMPAGRIFLWGVGIRLGPHPGMRDTSADPMQ